MCVVSMISDHYRDRYTDPTWPPAIPNWPTSITWPNTNPPKTTKVVADPAELEEFKREMGEKYDELRKTVEEMRDLLVKAKLYDERNGEPDCPMEEKVELIRRVARMVGVDLGDVFDGHGKTA